MVTVLCGSNIGEMATNDKWFIKPGFYTVIQIFLIVPVVSKLIRPSGRLYGNAPKKRLGTIRTIAIERIASSSIRAIKIFFKAIGKVGTIQPRINYAWRTRKPPMSLTLTCLRKKLKNMKVCIRNCQKIKHLQVNCWWEKDEKFSISVARGGRKVSFSCPVYKNRFS